MSVWSLQTGQLELEALVTLQSKATRDFAGFKQGGLATLPLNH